MLFYGHQTAWHFTCTVKIYRATIGKILHDLQVKQIQILKNSNFDRYFIFCFGTIFCLRQVLFLQYTYSHPIDLWSVTKPLKNDCISPKVKEIIHSVTRKIWPFLANFIPFCYGEIQNTVEYVLYCIVMFWSFPPDKKCFLSVSQLN